MSESLAVGRAAAGPPAVGTAADAAAGALDPRRKLQLALGVIWVLDGILQYQPSMFTKSFPDHAGRERARQPRRDRRPDHLVGEPHRPPRGRAERRLRHHPAGPGPRHRLAPHGQARARRVDRVVAGRLVARRGLRRHPGRNRQPGQRRPGTGRPLRDPRRPALARRPRPRRALSGRPRRRPPSGPGRLARPLGQPGRVRPAARVPRPRRHQRHAHRRRRWRSRLARLDRHPRRQRAEPATAWPPRSCSRSCSPWWPSPSTCPRPPSAPPSSLAVVLAAALWLAQGMGELFTGMATDPESGPLLALLSLAFWPAVPMPAVPRPAVPRPAVPAKEA